MENNYYLDLSDEQNWLIKARNGNRYTAGTDKAKANALIDKLNAAHRPNIEQRGINELWVCWNDHEKAQGCNYVREI